MKYGLVLEGGAMRGLFTAGILDVFTAEGITFDGAVGVSAGAVFGCNFKSGQLGRTLRYNLRFARDPRYCSFASLLLTGDLYGADFCYNAIPHHLDIFDEYAFARNPMQFLPPAASDSGFSFCLQMFCRSFCDPASHVPTPFCALSDHPNFSAPEVQFYCHRKYW